LRRYKSCLGQEEHSLSQDDEIRERQEKRFCKKRFWESGSYKKGCKTQQIRFISHSHRVTLCCSPSLSALPLFINSPYNQIDKSCRAQIVGNRTKVA
jgi:hypothetical protein